MTQYVKSIRGNGTEVLSELDVRGSVHRSTVLTVKTQQDATVYQNFIIPYFK
jgi:hypothetical protein